MIAASEIVIRKSENVTETSANGGRMTKTSVLDNGSQNYFPSWTAAQMSNGGTRYRKFFVHNTNDDLTLSSAGIHMVLPTPADDRITLFAGTQTDTQDEIDNSTQYGAGTLQSAVSAGATSFDIVLEDAGQTIFRSGDTIFLATVATTTDSAGHRQISQSEYHEDVTISKSGSVVTVTLAAGDMLANAYDAGSTVASVLPLGDIVAAIGTVAKVTSAGLLDAASITADNIGSIDQTVTLTFTSATAFVATSDVLGSLGSGSISGTFAPTNPDYSKPYLTIPPAAWGGTWVAGNTVTIPTTPAAGPFWAQDIVESDAASYGSNLLDLQIYGGSA